MFIWRNVLSIARKIVYEDISQSQTNLKLYNRGNIIFEINISSY